MPYSLTNINIEVVRDLRASAELAIRPLRSSDQWPVISAKVRDEGVGTSREEGNRDSGFRLPASGFGKHSKKSGRGDSPSPLILSLGGARKNKEKSIEIFEN